MERDHLISHALAAISDDLGERIKFFGGTALARSFLPSGRLSEAIALICIGPRADVAADLTRTLTRRLARKFGRPTFQPALANARGPEPVTAASPSGLRIQLQLLPSDHYLAWPFERRGLEQRYADAGPATLLVPTFDAFVAWKTITFLDRHAPRDLWDLASLARFRPFTQAAADLFATFGPFRSLPSTSTIPTALTEATWQHGLARQTRLTMTAAQARDEVVRAWAALDPDSATTA